MVHINVIRFGVRCWSLPLVALTFALLSSRTMYSQTASTGALTGVTLDPSGAALPGVILHLTKEDGSEEKSATSDNNGRFDFLLLRPGIYALQASKADFKPVSQPDIHVHVTETLRLELHLELTNPHRTHAGFSRAADGSTRYIGIGKSGEQRHSEPACRWSQETSHR